MVGREGFEPPKAFRQLIYSQPPLAAWVPPRSSQSVGAILFAVNRTYYGDYGGRPRTRVEAPDDHRRKISLLTISQIATVVNAG